MYLATAGESVCLYKTDNYKLHQVYKPPTKDKKGVIRDLSWSYDGRCFGIVVDGLSSVELFRVKEDVSLYEVLQVVDPLSIAFAKHGNGLVGIGSKNGVVHAINYLSKNESKSFGSCCAKITSVDFGSTDSSIAAGTSDGKTHIFATKSGIKTGLFELRTTQLVSSAKFHPIRRGILAVGCYDGSVTVWDVNFGHVEGQYLCHGAPCTGVVFSPNNTTFMASVGYDAVMYCFDIKSKKIILKAVIPEACSSLDIYKDGTTMAVGTAHGSVYVYDLRNLNIPLTHFVTRSSYVNKVAYQPPTSGGRKSLPPRRPSLTGRLFHKMDSPSFLERTDSSASSSGDVFSPLARGREIFSPLLLDENTFSLENSTSYQVASHSSLAKAMTESIIPGIKSTHVDANENSMNIQPCETNISFISSRGDRTQEFVPPSHSTASDFSYALPKSSLTLSTRESGTSMRCTEICESKQIPDSRHKDHIVPALNDILSRSSKFSDFSPKLPDISFLSDINCSESELKRVPKKPAESSLQEAVDPTLMNVTSRNSNYLSKSGDNLTTKLLDLSLLEVRKEDGEGEFFNELPQNSNLLPIDSAVNVTQDKNFGSYLNKSLSKLNVISVQNDIDTKQLTPDEPKHGDNVMEACGSVDFEDEQTFQAEFNEMLNKYSPSNKMKHAKNGQNFSMTFESSMGQDDKDTIPDGGSAKKLPSTLVSCNQSSEEVLPTKPLESGLGNMACADPEMSMENLKISIYEMLNDMCVELKEQMFIMHTFNISSQVKQEMMLSKIYSQLKKSTSDKSVGTD